MSLPTDIPDSLTGLRACKRCSLVKTFEQVRRRTRLVAGRPRIDVRGEAAAVTQFYDFGCENCGFLELKENRARVAECTSPFFEGCVRHVVPCAAGIRARHPRVGRRSLASIMDPQRSWVAKWQLLGACARRGARDCAVRGVRTLTPARLQGT